MVQSGSHLIWLDMEMTGLEPERDRIIELVDGRVESDERPVKTPA